MRNTITTAYDVTIRGKSVTVWKGNFVRLPDLPVKDFWGEKPTPSATGARSINESNILTQFTDTGTERVF
jgi:hypothetical protein